MPGCGVKGAAIAPSRFGAVRALGALDAFRRFRFFSLGDRHRTDRAGRHSDRASEAGWGERERGTASHRGVIVTSAFALNIAHGERPQCSFVFDAVCVKISSADCVHARCFSGAAICDYLVSVQKAWIQRLPSTQREENTIGAWDLPLAK